MVISDFFCSILTILTRETHLSSLLISFMLLVLAYEAFGWLKCVLWWSGGPAKFYDKYIFLNNWNCLL